MTNNTFDKNTIINSAIEGGILNIDKLLACNDFETIKEGLNNYPLTINEYLKQQYNNGDYRSVFQWAINNNVNRIADFIINDGISNDEYGIRNRTVTFDDLVDNEIAELKCKGIKFLNDSYFYTKNIDYFRRPKYPDVTKEEVINNIIKDISLRLDKETFTSELTREYFEDLYNKRNYELLVIKLCVRLEAILKCDFHYDGTFEEMLTRFSKEHGYINDDDGWGDYYTEETEQSKIFHRLRKYRNDIVHAEKNQEALSADEIKLAIEQVFKLG